MATSSESEQSGETKTTSGGHDPSAPATEGTDEFFRSYRMWFIYIALFCFFSFLFTDIPVTVSTILGAVALTCVVAFIDAVIKPEGPYESQPPQTPTEKMFGFIRFLGFCFVLVVLVYFFVLWLGN